MMAVKENQKRKTNTNSQGQASAKAQRNKARRLKRKSKLSEVSTSGNGNAMYPLPKGVDTGKKFFQPPKLGIKGLTKPGMDFLKCAFAPPDFSVTNVAGVPDDYRGPSLVKKHRSINSLNNSVASTDTYILLLPVPGAAYFVATTTAGVLPTSSVVFNAVSYSDSSSIFGNANSTDNVVDKFRFVSNHIELIPTVNQMSWTGNIQAWKLPVQFAFRPSGTATGAQDITTISGLNGITVTNSNQWTGPVNLGLYSACYNTDGDFDFSNITSGFPGATVPLTVGTSDWGQLNCSAMGSFTGFDNRFDSLVVKISGQGTNVLNSFIVKTWACVEYQVVAGSYLYEYQTLSPCDPYALDYYRVVIQQLPVGVSYLDNESFWARVLKILKTVTGAGMYLPGPYGIMSSGANVMLSGLEALTV